MSKASNQAVLQIYILAGCFNTLLIRNDFARVDLRDALLNGVETAKSAIRNWPPEGYGKKDHEWVMSRKDMWKQIVEDNPEDDFLAPILVKIAVEIATGLDEVLRNPYKRQLFAPLYGLAIRLDNFIDADGRNHIAYDKSRNLMRQLYTVLEMEAYA